MLKLMLSAGPNWTYNAVGHELTMSQSMVHSAVKRATQAKLFDAYSKRPVRKALEEFLIHGVKYAYPPDIGTVTRGIPTAFASPMLRDKFVHSDNEFEMHVWPHPEGNKRGLELSPLYKSVPEIAKRDTKLYAALGLLDAIRIGKARERQLAEELLQGMLNNAKA